MDTLLFITGTASGYLLMLFFDKKIVKKGKTRPSITFGFKDWQVHVHHWLMAGIFLLLVWVTDTFHIFPKMYLGLFSGIMLHDFHYDKDWYRVLKKKKNNKPDERGDKN